jgi:hypothetical protein
MHFGEIVENWATRCPKERALTQPSRAFGRPRENTEQNWARKALCGSRSFGRQFRSFTISPKWVFLLRKVRSDGAGGPVESVRAYAFTLPRAASMKVSGALCLSNPSNLAEDFYFRRTCGGCFGITALSASIVFASPSRTQIHCSADLSREVATFPRVRRRPTVRRNVKPHAENP